MVDVDDKFLKTNTKISSLRGKELEDFLILIDEYDFSYRNTLNLPSIAQFGTEIEYDDVDRREVDDFIYDNLTGWVSKMDGSIRYGGEITSPKMHDQISYWRELAFVCRYLHGEKMNSFGNAGGHIHVDKGIMDWSVSTYRKFLKLYMCYEHVLIRFGYGDKIGPRDTMCVYAPSVAGFLYSQMSKINKAYNMDRLLEIIGDIGKSNAINFGNIRHDYCRQTIEFRFPNTSDNEVIWQNNINTFCKMMISAVNLDEAYLTQKIKEKEHKFGNKQYIKDINLLDSLEFCDLIFDNNLDKIYFLKQYLKGFEVIKNNEEKNRFIKQLCRK